MYGAILGDIVGSVFEFDRGPWTKDFDMFGKGCSWTDDTVMTVAVAEALLGAGKDASIDEIKTECIKSMKKWGQKYPYAGYGSRFVHWVLSDDPKPYNSLGNGSAMRVSAAGWLYDSLERTREVARATAEVSHNHPEGIKGAECTAAVIFMARTGETKEKIWSYVKKEFSYDISKTVDEMRPFHRHDETCMEALPKALVSFFEGESYEDVVRNAISLGGDTDTIAAIAGAMAEAFFDMPLILRAECQLRVEEDMYQVMSRFDQKIGRQTAEDDTEENAELNKIYHAFAYEEDEELRVQRFMDFLNALTKSAYEEATAPTPYDDVNNVLLSDLNIDQIMAGDQISLKEDVRLKMDTMQGKDDKLWLPLFLTKKELNKGNTANIIIPTPIYDILIAGFNREDVAGVVVNPFGRAFTMTKEILGAFLDAYVVWVKKTMKEKEKEN